MATLEPFRENWAEKLEKSGAEPGRQGAVANPPVAAITLPRPASTECPLLALSGHWADLDRMTALEGKADIQDQYLRPGYLGPQR